MLHQQRLFRRRLGPPWHRTDILRPARISKHILDLLERLARRLGERNQDVQEHGDVEDAEEDVGVPLDVDESGGHEVAEGEIKSPVRRGGQGDGFAAHAERVEFGRVDPAYGTPGWGVGGDEEVGAGDDGFGWGAGDGPGGFGGVVYTLRACVMAV